MTPEKYKGRQYWNASNRGQTKCSAVKSPEYTVSITQHLHKSSQLSVTPVPGVFGASVGNNHTCSTQTTQ